MSAITEYLQLFWRGCTEYGGYLYNEVVLGFTNVPWYGNYFYWLVLLSLAVWALELALPWRKGQKAVRRDFWMDGFYMFFNFFLFSLIAFNGLSMVGVQAFTDFLGLFGVENLVAIELNSWPAWARFLLLFFVADFVQWSVHVMLHRVPILWQFHKLHHSVKEMGFAAHLRYHWMENVFYKTALFLPLTMIGYGLEDLFLYHMFTVLIGHLNHANVGWDYGPLKYFFNNPKMHIWHHAKELPSPYGVNFGISLSIWDYIFNTAYVPHSGRDIELGFDDEDEFPDDFLGQIGYPLTAGMYKDGKRKTIATGGSQPENTPLDYPEKK